MEAALSDILWADEPIERGAFVGSAVKMSLGLGMLSGAAEAIAIGASSKLVMPMSEAVILATTSVVLGGLLAAGGGLFVGLLGAWLFKADPTRNIARVLGLVAGGLAAFHLWPSGLLVLAQPGRTPQAMAFFAMPFGVIGFVNLYTRFIWRWSDRRVEEGKSSGPSWLLVSTTLSLMVSSVSAIATSSGDYSAGRALDSDPNVLLVTIDTLRRDHVSAYGDSPVQTPNLDALAAEGVLFENAVTPFPETVPAHASLFTGLHPVRTGVLSNGHQLSGRYPTLTEKLGNEGYATAAFVSSFAVHRQTGLDRGFQAYDDGFFSGVRGLNEIRIAHLSLRALMRFGDPARYRHFLERSAEDTLGRSLDWMVAHGENPFFMWVHLFEPHAPYETHGAPGAPNVDHRAILADESSVQYGEVLTTQLRTLYAEEVAHTDQVLGDFIEQVRATVDRPMMIVVVSDHGEMLGEHEIYFNHHGIWDETIRIPMIIVPHKEGYDTKLVRSQARLMDLPNTMLSMLDLSEMEGTESGDLSPYMRGEKQRDYASLLMGRMGRSLSAGTVLGYRAAKQDADDFGQMVKFIWDTDSDSVSLYDLATDPSEAIDIHVSQSAAVDAMQSQIRKELGTAAPEGKGRDAAAIESLRALGYVE